MINNRKQFKGVYQSSDTSISTKPDVLEAEEIWVETRSFTV